VVVTTGSWRPSLPHEEVHVERLQEDGEMGQKEGNPHQKGFLLQIVSYHHKYCDQGVVECEEGTEGSSLKEFVEEFANEVIVLGEVVLHLEHKEPLLALAFSFQDPEHLIDRFFLLRFHQLFIFPPQLLLLCPLNHMHNHLQKAVAH